MQPKHAVLLLPVLLLVIFIAGCAKNELQQEELSYKLIISEPCIQACHDAKQTKNLDTGPCLLDPIPENADYVCDVAHSPRQPIDNQPENQCQAFRSGVATHFIEITPECGIIRVV